MIKRIIITTLISFACMCDNGPTGENEGCTPFSDPNQTVEILYPQSGDVFELGDTVVVSYKLNPFMVPTIKFAVKNDGGFESIYDHSVPVFDNDQIPSENDTIQCGTITWIIGDEYFPANYSGTDTITVRLSEYNDPSLCDTIPGIVIKSPEGN